MFVDSHCHLNYFPKDEWGGLIQRAHENGVETMLSVCTKLEDVPTILEVISTYENIWGSVGIHPNDALAYDDWQHLENQLNTFLNHEKMVAIGETGLDYFYDKTIPKAQKDNFLLHLDVAQKNGVPIIIHTRDAEQDTIDMLKQFPKIKGVLHCFTGSLYLAEQALSLGLYISFSGIITFKNAQELRDIVSSIPLEKMLIETDCPYLTPHPHRGKKNEPSYVPLVAQQIAQLKNCSIEEIAQTTSKNFYHLFL
jgi:TatD DNase family protein